MSVFLLPSFNIAFILICGTAAWLTVRRHLLR